MKSILKVLMLATMIISSPHFISAQIGPVVKISETESSIPLEIKKFINDHFPNATYHSIDLKTMEGIYEIELNNGYEFEFLNTGQLLDIDAPQGIRIPSNIIVQILPSESVAHLRLRGDLDRINEVTYKPNWGYKVEVEKIDKKEKNYCFDLEGKIIKNHKRHDKRKGCN